MHDPELKREPSLDIPSLLAIAVAACVLCWPLLRNEALHRGSDVSFHVTWAQGFIESLRDWNLYPRWNATINKGLGGPVFVFYPPLAFYATALVNVVTRDLIGAFRVVFVLGGFLSGFTFFMFARRFASRFWATVGSVLYVLLPYHALDLYDRFAYAEYLGLIWIPILFTAVRRLASDRSTNGWTLLAVSLAGLILTHILTAFMAVFVVGPYGLALIAREKNWRALVPIVGAGLLGAACTGIYLVPAIAERELVQMDLIEIDNLDWSRHLLYSEREDPGGAPTVIRPLIEKVANRHILVTLVAGGLLTWCTRRASFGRTFEAWLFFALAVGTIIVQTSIAVPLWESLPGWKTIQFPWRFFAFHAMALSALVASLGIPGAKEKARGILAGRWGMTLLVALAAVPGIAYTVELHSVRPFTYSATVARHPRYENRLVREYLPASVTTWQTVNAIGSRSSSVRVGPQGDASIVEWRPQRRVFNVEAPGPATLTLWTFDYPGWRATVDGNPVEIRPARVLPMIQVLVPSGSHRVEIVFGRTTTSTIGSAVSITGVLVFLVMLIIGRVRAREKTPRTRRQSRKTS